MGKLLFMILLFAVSGAYAQEWWDIKYHEGSGSNSGAFNNNTELIKNLHKDPKLRQQDKVAISKNEESILESKSARKRLEENDNEKHRALLEIQKKALESNDGSIVECNSCQGYGREECTFCMGRGYSECTVCKGSFRICRPCDGTGAINERTCSTCAGTGKGVCNFCSGKEIIVCGNCEGLGYNNCRNCHGLGKDFVHSEDSLRHSMSEDLKAHNYDTLSKSELNWDANKKAKLRNIKQK